MGYLTLALFAACLGGEAAHAATFDAIGAGDMTGHDVILWARATHDNGPVEVYGQVAMDAGFQQIVWTGLGATKAENDFTIKMNAGGLIAGTQYFYRFVADTTSLIGRFATVPAPDQQVTVTFGMTGDADGRFRPYPAIAGIERHALDFFIFNGDTIYETASGRDPSISPAAPKLFADSSPAEAAAALSAYYRKYRENVLGTAEDGTAAAAGQQSLAPLFRATGHYTLLDNHELGNAALQSGGAPLALRAARNPAATPAYDANVTGTFVNRSLGFQTLEKAFFDYHPMRADIAGTPAAGLKITGPKVEAASDPRTHGTALNYLSRRWGKHVLYVQIDDRSYRDARLGNASGGELSAIDPRSANPNRTMLGQTQLAWLKRTLLSARESGVTWIFIAISSPIDMVGGPPTGQTQDQKSWYGGYRAERNALLKFIADNKLEHVVFLATDDHMARATRLQYETGEGEKALVPGAFQLAAGPIGAEGPDWFAEHGYASILARIIPRVESQLSLGQPPDGLAGLPGLMNVRRDFDPNADTKRDPIDFLSPDTFNYAVVSVGADGVLTVSVFGIPSYAPNRNFTAPAEAEHEILSFQVKP